jgi:hypothetical protein
MSWLNSVDCEVFAPAAIASDNVLNDGIDHGLWITDACIVAMAQLSEDHHQARAALAFIGRAVLAEITTKIEELRGRAVAEAEGGAE